MSATNRTDAGNGTLTGTTDGGRRATTTVGQKAAAAGGKVAITDLVATGDKVSVSFQDKGGTLHASEVRVTAKAAPGK